MNFIIEEHDKLHYAELNLSFVFDGDGSAKQDLDQGSRTQSPILDRPTHDQRY